MLRCSTPATTPKKRPSRGESGMLFENRFDAGRRLATRLRGLADARPIVLGLPRGGVPVAYEVAAGLRAPLDVISHDAPRRDAGA